MHRFRQAAGQREPQPDADGALARVQPLEGREDPVPVGRGDAWPVVDDAQGDPVGAGTGGRQRRRSARRVPQRVRGHVRDDPFQERRIDHDLGHLARNADKDRPRLRPDAAEGTGDDLRQDGRPGKHREHARLQAAHVKQAGQQVAELAKRLVGGGEQFGLLFGCQLDIGGTKAAHRRFRRGQRCAQVVADGGEQRGPHPVGLRDGRGHIASLTRTRDSRGPGACRRRAPMSHCAIRRS